jgi:xylulokinase
MALVAGVDSSTQACKVVVRDADTGAWSGRAARRTPTAPRSTPAAWGAALDRALAEAGGLDDVAAVAVGGQQHGMVCLDDDGAVVRDALLWNDTRSPGRDRPHRELGDDGGGRRRGPTRSGCAGRLVHRDQAALAGRAEPTTPPDGAVCLPHDWLTWAGGSPGARRLVTDRGDASGTGLLVRRHRRVPPTCWSGFGRTRRAAAVLGPAERAEAPAGRLGRDR